LLPFEPVGAAVTFSPGSACTRSGDTITCTGDLSAGVDAFNSAPDTVSTLIVSSSTPISVSGLAGISFQSDGVIFITSKAVITSQTRSGIYAEGTSGDVTVRQTGNITALGNDAGIYVISSVPGGSTAGNLTVTQFGDITAAHGGAFAVTSTSTGSNGTAGDVTVTQTGNIASQGVGIWANSAAAASNGRGGDVTVTQTGNIVSLDYGIEAFSKGGDNGAAGRVTVTQSGNISTQTDDAFGITAYSYIVPNDHGTTGDVTVTQAGNITTQGEDAYGIWAYSVTDHGTAGHVTVRQTGNITTQADGAYAIQAYSNAPIGTVGNVTVAQAGNITTTGTGSYAIQAFSRGGTVAGDVTVTQTGNILTSGDSAYGIFASSQGDMDGGDVTVVQTGNITTSGDDAYGIQAYSEMNPFSSLTSSAPGNVTVTQTGNITLQSGDGIYAWSEVGLGTAGNVTVTQTGNIVTPENGAYGIHAFSAAEDNAGRVTVTQTGDITAQGGGGILAVSNIHGAAGTANDVTVTQTGNIASHLDGIYAQSSGGSSSGTAGHVTVTQSGQIAAGDYGIYARIHGQAGTGSIVVNLTDSTIQGGGSSKAGVRLEGLASSSGTLNTYGVTAISASSGTAVSATDGDDTINNFGVLTTVGTVDLGAGTNFINNMAGATYNSGTAINLGAGNLFTNDGTLSPGGSDTIATTSITGTFLQTSTGQLLTDINLANGTSDLTTVSGTASLAGNVRVRTTDFALGQQQVTVFSAAGGTTDDGLGLISSPALHTSLLFPNANDVAVVAYIDFMPASMGLNHNQTDLANYLNRAAAAGSPGLNSLLLALVNGPANMTEYRSALNQLLPAVFLNSETTSMLSSAEFSNDLFSCNIRGTGNAFIRQDECVWVRPKSRRFDSEGTSQNIGYDDRATGLSAGAQFRFAPDWFATIALGYERGNTETSAGAKSESDHYQAGLGLKYQTGSWLFAGAVSGGIAQFETMRTIAFPEFASVVAQSDPDIRFVTGQLRAAYLSDFGSWYAKPLVDMRVTYLDRDAVTETGGGSANLWVSGSSETTFSISPAVEFGTEYAIGLGTAMKPFLKTGVTYVADTHSSLTAGFVGSAPGVTGFTIDSNMDDLYADIEAGVQIFTQDGSSLSFGYKEMVSEDTRQNSVFAKGTMKF
jgi:hypothetical protein